MDDWEIRGSHPPRGEHRPRGEHPSAANDTGASPLAGALTAAAFVAPWALLSLALPTPWRWKALALLAMLGLLLTLAAIVAERLARARGLDGAFWSFVAVVTFGLGMFAAYRVPPGHATHPQFLCRGCDRIGDAREPFCFGCGSYS